MPVSQRTLGIVWAETSRLKPTDGSAPAVLPPVGSPGGQVAAGMASVVEIAVATGQQAGARASKEGGALGDNSGWGAARSRALVAGGGSVGERRHSDAHE
jgi:hypothetical protein